MTDQKLENLLNLSLDATETERDKSLEMNVGYDTRNKEWELIVKYSGNLTEVAMIAEQVTELLGEFAIVRIRESRIEELSRVPQIEYMEKQHL